MSASIPLHDRSFDLFLLSDWEDQIIYEAENDPQLAEPMRSDLMAPVNTDTKHHLESQFTILRFHSDRVQQRR